MSYKANMYLDYEVMHDKVTGSCILCKLRLPNKTIFFLVDCGLYQEKEYLSRNDTFKFDPADLSYVFLTHIHTDHCGRLPMLYRHGYKNKIHMTYISKELLPISLNNTLEILKQDSKKRVTLYDNYDLEQTYKNMCGYNYNKLIKIDDHISVIFLENGHLFGATSIFMKFSYPGEKDINIVFSGDYASTNTFFEVRDIPNSIKNLPVTILQEATYGGMKSNNIKQTLLKNIKEAVRKNKSILFPAFAIGRYQETEYLVHKCQKERIIPKRYRICLDGVMPHDYNSKLSKLSNIFNSNFKNCTPEKAFQVVTEIKEKSNKSKKKVKSKRKEKLKLVLREKVISSKRPQIVISTSGMGSNGASNEYIMKWLYREDVLIQFLGYMAEGTLGRTLQDMKKDDNNGIKADIKFTNEKSSHDKQEGLIKFINKFNKVNCIFINHGDTSNKEAYEKSCKKHTSAKDVIILQSGYVYRIGAYGYMKSFKRA